MGNRRDSIFFVIESSFPEYTGGIENWLWNVAVRITERYNVYIISESTSIYKNSFYTLPDGIRLLRYKTWRNNRLMRFLLRGCLRKYEVLCQSKAIERLMESNVKRPSETILFALGTITPSLGAYRFKKKHPEVLYVSSSRGPHAEVETTARPALEEFFYSQEYKNMKNADVVFVNGYDTKKYYEGFGISGEVLLNGVDAERIENSNVSNPYDEMHQSIVSVGSLLDIKGVNELIKAFAVIEKSGKNNAYLYFVGKGDPTKYKNLASELGVGGEVFFLGNKSDVAPYLKHADVIACLSGGGGFSMAALEAMSSNRPIVAWDTDVYRQFNKDAHTMELVEYNNVPLLAEKVQRMLKNPEQYTTMANNANRISHQFSWSNVIGIMEERFKNI